MKFYYLFCNQIIVSTVPLPALPLITGGRPDFWFRFEKSNPQEEKVSWHHEWLGSLSEKLLLYGKLGEEHVLRFPSLADFVISPSASQIVCFPVPETPQETIQHLFLDQVLPRCLAHRGMVMLHASAVSLSRGVVLFTGPSGGGKSTLAGYFHQTGGHSLSDDCVRILFDQDLVKVIPSYDSLRLWPDAQQFLYPTQQKTTRMAHYSNKLRLQLSDSEGTPSDTDHQEGYPILAVMVLYKSEPAAGSEIVGLEKIPLREAFIEMMKQTFLLDVTDQGHFTHLMGVLGQVIPRVQSYKLRLPHDYKFLPQVREMILDEISLHQPIHP